MAGEYVVRGMDLGFGTLTFDWPESSCITTSYRNVASCRSYIDTEGRLDPSLNVWYQDRSRTGNGMIKIALQRAFVFTLDHVSNTTYASEALHTSILPPSV